MAINDPAALEAMAAGAARGLRNQLRAERPDLSWEVRVGPLDRAKVARLEATGGAARVEGALWRCIPEGES